MAPFTVAGAQSAGVPGVWAIATATNRVVASMVSLLRRFRHRSRDM
jgi:hypothetical protein